MEKIFESLIHVTPIIIEMFDGDVAINICDKNECLYASDGKNIKSPLKTGEKLDSEMLAKTGIAENIYKKKKTFTTIYNREIFGMNLKVIMIPAINDKGEAVGYIALARNIEEFTKVKQSTEELKCALLETNSTVSEITNSAVQLSEKLNTMIENTKDTERLITESSEAVTLIESISKQSNLLGLNAAIESSRAGEYGKGFSVVAGEMRKLASNSGESSKKISAALAEMSNSMKIIIETINELGQIATNQAASLEEVSATVEQITSNSQVLVDNLKMN